MPSIPLHISPHLTSPSSDPSTTTTTPNTSHNGLPSLLHTPTGLALLEIQGQIHTDTTPPSPDLNPGQISIGELVFPLYDPNKPKDDTSWMKTVHMYVGKHQRMTGEVKKLGKAFAVVRKKVKEGEAMEVDGHEDAEGEELEIVDIVRWKVLFKSRPEPVDAVV